MNCLSTINDAGDVAAGRCDTERHNDTMIIMGGKLARTGIGGVAGNKDFILCGMNIHTEFAQLLFHCFNAVTFLDTQSACIVDIGISRGIHSKDS